MTLIESLEDNAPRPTESLAHRLLMPMPTQTGSYFGDTLVYLCRHNEDGAFGLVINKELDVTFDELLQQQSPPAITQEPITVDYPVYDGGPVREDHGFVLHSDDRIYPGSDPLGSGLCLTLTADLLAAVNSGDGPQRLLIALGYAGWGAGQLESELAAEAWLTLGASDDLLFDVPAEQRLSLAARRAGIQLDLLGGHIGRC
ncbi:MAG: YqgE/AlgH family protein [Pseudomonadota bacterium]